MSTNLLPQLPSLTQGIAHGETTPRSVPTTPEGKARRAAEEFEAIYLSLMFSSMFTGIDSDGPFSGGQGEKIFRSQLYEELGRSFARAGGIGIADAVQREIMKRQEV